MQADPTDKKNIDRKGLIGNPGMLFMGTDRHLRMSPSYESANKQEPYNFLIIIGIFEAVDVERG
ncbi:hypothetical protein GCM10010911_06620 [Paenibacillus nasutitermitis]|uniref:Uncharacterized protein n=1 Tax=Paenibacillus nasutitermitis TaxID=1652958 RepID=A0A916YNL4_9BACL|nr:hypothetical protein GCM10010911_06620 [Paenibacillus nasutitermitis]